MKLQLTKNYIQPNELEQCFNVIPKFDNRIVMVDKTLTGVGGTTSFLNKYFRDKLKPNQINLLIAPNVSVVKEKELQIQNEDIGFGNTDEIIFVYGGSSIKTPKENTKLIVGVADSIVMLLDSWSLYPKLRDLSFNLVLIDELHTTYSGATFRSKLVDLLDKIRSINQEAKIVGITATPLLFQRCDVTIVPKELPNQNVLVCSNAKDIVLEIQDRIYNKKPFIVFSNNSNQISSIFKLKNNKRLISCDLNGITITGASIEKKLSEKLIVQQKHSDYACISSAGFEGISVNTTNNEEAIIYFFHNVEYSSEKYLLGNVVQAINRIRNNNSKQIKYIRIDSEKDCDFYSNYLQLIEKNSDKIVKNNGKLEKLIKDKTIQEMFSRMLSINDNIKFKDINYQNLLEELDLFNGTNEIFNAPLVKNYLSQRGINLEFEDSIKQQYSRTMEKKATKLQRIEANKNWLVEKGIANKFSVEYNTKKMYALSDDEKIKYIYDEIIFLRDKFIVCDIEPNKELKLICSIGLPKFKKLVLKWLEIAKKSKTTEEIENKILVTSKEEFYDKNRLTNVLILLCSFLEQGIRFRIESSSRVRDYNITTKVSKKVLIEICKYFNLSMYSSDIKSMAIRYLYSAVGVEVPENVYGKDKINKKRINTILNTLSYSGYCNKQKENRKNPIELKTFKQQKKRDLLSLGIDEKVVEYALNRYVDEDSDLFFYDYAGTERDIINEVKRKATYLGIDSLMIRRHDEIILIGLNKDNEFIIDSFNEILLSITKNNIGGWFDKLVCDSEGGGKNEIIENYDEVEQEYEDDNGKYSNLLDYIDGISITDDRIEF